MEELFEHTSVRRAYFTLALPVVLNMVVALVYNLVDTFFVAQTQNANLVAGVSLGAPLFTLMVALGDILGLGGSSVISRLFGEKRFDQARRVSGYCFYAGFLLGLIVLVLLFLLQTPVLKLLGGNPGHLGIRPPILSGNRRWRPLHRFFLRPSKHFTY